MAKSIFRLCLTLFLICSIAAGLLAVVNFGTRDRINENIKKDMEKKASEIFGNGIALEKMEYQSKTVTEVYIVHNVNEDGNPLPYLFRVAPEGSFGGGLELLVGIYPNGTIAGVRVLANAETPGVGSKALKYGGENDHLNKYDNKTSALEKIDFIAGASITSKAVNDGVNSALEAFKIITEVGAQ